MSLAFENDTPSDSHSQPELHQHANIPDNLSHTEPNQADEPLPNSFPLSDINTHYPTEVRKTFSSYMIYKIDFKWHNQSRSIERRYSTFRRLREVLRLQLPFSLIFPIHQKSISENMSSIFLADRTEEMNYFLRFIIHSPKKFLHCEKSLSIFFDPVSTDEQVMTHFSKFKKMGCNDLLELYRDMIPHDQLNVPSLELRKQIEDYHLNLLNGLEFFEVT